MIALLRVRTALLAAVGIVAGLSACSSVPTSGPIQQGPVVDSGESTQLIRVIAAPPSTGASPEGVVRGFLEANASLENDHGIARRYLTPEAAVRWTPGLRATVYSLSSLEVTGRGPRVTATVGVTGELLADGSLVTVDPPRPRRVGMTLARVAQEERNLPLEWRIADPPDELLISDSDLRRAYREQHVYFLANSSQTLVPDARLLPVIGPTLPTALAEQVLAGPAAWLAPGMVSERSTPEGTALAFGSVPVNDGVATVELTDRALAASPQQRRALAAELTWTLTQLPDVRAVEIRVAGGAFQVQGLPVLMDRATWLRVAPDQASLGPAGTTHPAAFVLRGQWVARVTDAGETSIPLPTVINGPVTGLAVSMDEGRASVIDPKRNALWVYQLDDGSEPRQLPVTNDGAGSFAPDGSFWFTSDGAVRRLSESGELTPVPVVERPPAGITLVRVARDGVRVAVVAGGRALLGVIERSTEGASSIVSLQPLVGSLRGVRDLSWRSATDMDVLGSLSGTGRQVVRIGVGTGTAQGLRAPTGTTDLAAAPAATTLAVAADRIIHANVGLQWRQQGPGESVAYPG